jgi:hypothetical protein
MILHKCQIPEWKIRALKFAHNLKGREDTRVEKEFRAKHPDPWDFVRVFDIDESRQRYINYTIQLIEKCDNLGDQIICELRLEWSAKKLLMKK